MQQELRGHAQGLLCNRSGRPWSLQGDCMAFMRQSSFLVINPIMVDYFAALYDSPDLKLFILVGWDRSAWSTWAQLMIFFCFRFPAVFGRPGISICHATCIC